MPIRMVALNRSKTGEWIARKSVPKDVRVEYSRLYSVGWEAILKLPANTSKAQAKSQLGQWLAEVETRIERIRAAAKGEGQPLTRQNAMALAGRWYAYFVARHESDLKTPKYWADLQDHFIWDILSPHAPVEHHEAHGTHAQDDTWPWLDLPEVLEATAPTIREWALTASFLSSEGLKLTAEAELLFVAAVRRNFTVACARLEGMAAGNYSRDKFPETFPVYVRQGVSTGMSCWELFGAYVAARQPAASTISRWRAVFKHLQAAYPGSAGALTEENARAWKDTLVTPKRRAVTVDAVWLPAAKTVFAWGVSQKHVRINPFTSVKIDVPKAVVLREEGKAFKPEEARVILRAATAITNLRDALPRAKRWVMWVCAYSGARSGEITQLRGIDVTPRGDFYVMRLTPEANTIKNSNARTVPLHEHLIDQGFIEFVRAQGDGPLFYNVRAADTDEADPLNPKNHPSIKTRGRLGVWVRELGITDPEVGPTHGWRHTFQQIADRVGITEKMSDAITGHAPASVGRRYGPATIEDMAEALKKFPRYIV
jgi:integrase